MAQGPKCMCECVKVICASSVVYACEHLSVCVRALSLSINNVCVCVCVEVCAGQCQ